MNAKHLENLRQQLRSPKYTPKPQEWMTARLKQLCSAAATSPEKRRELQAVVYDILRQSGPAFHN